jgi:NAD-dependent deacetylase
MTTTTASIDRAAQLLAHADRVVVLTGAGVSAESGIATFRDAQTGLWSRFSPTQLASQAGFAADPGLVWRWYMQRLSMVEEAQPNPGHRALAELERLSPSFTLITQNVDELHERAGSREVLHLHGSIARFRCNKCKAPYLLQEADRNAPQPPCCVTCGGLVRPDVVWFGEFLPQQTMERASRAAERCSVMLVVGTSGVVYPAAELPFVAKQGGAHVVDVNPETNPISGIADCYLQGPGGEILPLLMERLQPGLRLES